MADPYESAFPTVRESMVRLLTNWGKNANKAMVDQFAAMAEKKGFTPEQVERGVDRIIEEWPGDNAPQGFGKVLPYLGAPANAKRQPRTTMGWWGQDGDWGGDWSKASRKEVLYVAAVFFEAMRPHAIAEGLPNEGELRDTMAEGGKARCEEFLRLAYARRVNRIYPGDVETAAGVLKAGGTTALRRFVEDPEGYHAARAEQQAAHEGLLALERRQIGLVGRMAA